MACPIWLRKKTLMALRSLLWHADEWLHRREVRLREEISNGEPEIRERMEGVGQGAALRVHSLAPKAAGAPGKPHRPTSMRSETFLQWEARRSGVAVVSKKEARRRRQISASAFDLRFSKSGRFA
jgi:hypothetical protein